MTWRELTACQLNDMRQLLIIDVRSPCEHAQERIPGSTNVPLLSDAERAEVGTIYAEQGELVARRQALKIIAPKIPAIVDEIANLRQSGQPLVIHCWRGGLRSEAVASFLSVVGLDCFRLTGGYKAWRKEMLSDFQANSYTFTAVILHGLTGVGKTDILRELSARGQSVLDLEAIANHRGSVFGGMGLGDQLTQKNFDGELWQALRRLGNEPVLMEAESRKIGRIALPDCVYERIQAGPKILVTGSLEARAQRIFDDYAHVLDEAARANAVESLMCLKERLGAKRVQEIQEMFCSGHLHEAVKILLIEYYDPLYYRQIERARPFDLEVSGDDVDRAARDILSWLQAQAQTPSISKSRQA